MIFLLIGLIGFVCLACLALAIGTSDYSRVPRVIPPPLVEPAPDAFPLRYRSPYVRQLIGTEGVINGRPWRRDNEGNPIFGYQPRYDLNRSEPPQGGSVIALPGITMQEAGEALLTMNAAMPHMQDYLQPPAQPQSDPPQGEPMECEVAYE